MYHLARRRSGLPKDLLAATAKIHAEPLDQEIACLKEKDAALARRLGYPPVGSELTNLFGIKWVIDGYTTAASVATLGHSQELRDQENLYPVAIPQNLNESVTRIAEELNLCTPKDFVPLDTIPYLRKGVAAPFSHSIDSMSDPHRILLFLDAATLHEAAFAHELGHLWIELVDGIEDYRAYRDLTDVVRYTQVQHLQSFVLDVQVNNFLRQRGIDLTPIENDRRISLAQLAKSVSDGYVPPSPWESVLIGTILAEALIESDGSLPVAANDELAFASSSLTAESGLADSLIAIVREHHLDSRQATEQCINRILTTCFVHAGEHLDLEDDLVTVEPAVEWHDKWPTWLHGLTPRQKCEVGRALARSGAGPSAHIRLQDAGPNVRAEFSADGNVWSDSVSLSFSGLRPPGPPGYRPKTVMEVNEENRRRQMQQFNDTFPPQPGQRSYSTGLGRFITQVRMEELLEPEHPYAYAFNNPVTYVDPSGLSPACPQQGDPTQGWIQGMNQAVKNWFDNLLYTPPPPPFKPFPCSPKTEKECRDYCASIDQTFVDCTVVGEFFGINIINCNCDACPPFKNLPLCSAGTPGHIIRPGQGTHNFPVPINTLKKNCLDKIVTTTGTAMPRKGIGRDACKYTGTCFGKTVIVTVGFGSSGPCISDAYFAK